jgi:hypothetical protein
VTETVGEGVEVSILRGEPAGGDGEERPPGRPGECTRPRGELGEEGVAKEGAREGDEIDQAWPE